MMARAAANSPSVAAARECTVRTSTTAANATDSPWIGVSLGLVVSPGLRGRGRDGGRSTTASISTSVVDVVVEAGGESAPEPPAVTVVVVVGGAVLVVVGGGWAATVTIVVVVVGDGTL